MQRRLLAGTLLAAAALLAPSAARPEQGATVLSVRATLDGQSEVPPLSAKQTRGRGRLVGTLRQTKTGYQFSWYLTFTNLSGKATFASIERGGKRSRGPTLTFLCSPCRTGAHGTFYASPGEALLVAQGALYVNVRTKQYPAGEIRGPLRKLH